MVKMRESHTSREMPQADRIGEPFDPSGRPTGEEKKRAGHLPTSSVSRMRNGTSR